MPDRSKLYNGKGVIAMPSEPISFEGFPRVGDDVSVSSNRSGGSRYGGYRNRSRSRSNAGSGSISRSRDIVQEVYDKMGVNYVRGQPLGMLLTNNKESTDNQNDTHKMEAQTTTPRSLTRIQELRSTGGNTNTPPIPRSSRAGVSQQWPALGPMDEVETVPTSSALPPTKGRFGRLSLPIPSPAAALRNNQADKRDADDSKVFFAQDADERDTTSIVSSSGNERHGTSKSGSGDFARNENEYDAASVVSCSRSVKERIGMYRASTGGSHGGGFGRSSLQKHPPKINLYDSPNNAANFSRSVNDDAIEIDQRSCIGVNRNEYSGDKSVSRLSLGDAWLSAINGSNIPSSGNTVSGGTVTKNISVVEIPHADMQGHDNRSAASSVSGEDFLVSPRHRSHRSSAGKISSVFVEKIVEERVQSQVAVLNRKFEAEIRRIENRIEKECKASIRDLEKRNQELADKLAKTGVIRK
jgi:hypothetical protein